MLYRSVSGGRWADPCLSSGEFRAELLSDFRIDPDGISMWSGSADVAAKALAVGQRQIRKIVLLEIDDDILKELRIGVVVSPANVPKVANPNAHRNITCPSGPLLFRLLARLSRDPVYSEFDSNQVRSLLGECVADGLNIGELEPRVIEDLIRKGVVGESEGRQALGELYQRNPCMISELKVSEVYALVDAGIVPRESGVLLHRGFLAAEANRQ